MLTVAKIVSLYDGRCSAALLKRGPQQSVVRWTRHHPECVGHEQIVSNECIDDLDAVAPEGEKFVLATAMDALTLDQLCRSLSQGRAERLRKRDVRKWAADAGVKLPRPSSKLGEELVQQITAAFATQKG